MSLAIRGAWQPVADIAGLPGHLGVFELGDAQASVLYVGFAGGHSRYGLRSAIQDALQSVAQAQHFRFEVNTAYLTRYQELVMFHRAAGRNPAIPDMPMTFGRLNPAGDQAK